jgi:ankyrin repeat protein
VIIGSTRYRRDMAEWDELGRGTGVGGRTALHAAANHDGEPHLERLLQSTGLPIDTLDAQGATPLHWASELGCPEVIRTLARLGASLDVKDGAGHTPIDLAVLSREPLTIDALIDAGARAARLESLLEAAAMGSVPAMRLIPPTARNTAGQSLAHWAAEHDRIELLPAEVNVADEGGRVALHCARSAQMTRALLQRGADVRATDAQGNTALHWLGHFATAEQVQLLLEAGADPRARNAGGFSPLEHALEHGLHPAMELLGAAYVFAGEDLSEPGWSVTHYAAALGSPSAVSALRVAGRLDEPSDDGYSVLDQARAFGCEVAVRLISGG